MEARRSYIATLVGALGISNAPILFTLADVHPTTGAVWRYLYALPVLVTLLAVRGRGALGNGAWLPIAALSGVFFAADMALWHHSVVLIGAGPGTLLVNTQVLWVALFGLAFLREPPLREFWIALPIAFLGMFLISGGDLGGIEGSRDRAGLTAALVASLCYAGMLITLRRAQHASDVVPEAVLVVQVGVALALLTGVGLAEGSLPVSLAWQQHAWLALLGVGVQALSWMLITSGIRGIPGHHGAILLITQPVASLLLGWWILGQALSPARWIGAALIVAAIALALRSEPRTPRSPMVRSGEASEAG